MTIVPKAWAVGKADTPWKVKICEKDINKLDAAMHLI